MKKRFFLNLTDFIAPNSAKHLLPSKDDSGTNKINTYAKGINARVFNLLKKIGSLNMKFKLNPCFVLTTSLTHDFIYGIDCKCHKYKNLFLYERLSPVMFPTTSMYLNCILGGNHRINVSLVSQLPLNIV